MKSLLTAPASRDHRERLNVPARSRSERGFTLLEVLVATAIMGIAVAGVLSGLSASARNAARLTAYDRATLLGKSKMDELIVDQKVPRKVPLEGLFDPALTGGVTAGWRAMVVPFENAPGAGPGMWVLDRIQVEIWWMEGMPSAPVRHAFTLEGYRRGILRAGDL
jgi:general secretion pathway protein I